MPTDVVRTWFINEEWYAGVLKKGLIDKPGSCQPCEKLQAGRHPSDDGRDRWKLQDVEGIAPGRRNPSSRRWLDFIKPMLAKGSMSAKPTERSLRSGKALSANVSGASYTPTIG
jgi:hypothetical protein